MVASAIVESAHRDGYVLDLDGTDLPRLIR